MAGLRLINMRDKGQAYWMDYSMALFLFLVMLSIFLASLSNIESDSGIQEMKKKADFVSNTFLEEGMPLRWTSDNFSKIGFRVGKKLSKLRIYEFDGMTYYDEKSALALRYDFAVVFTNGSGAIQNLGNLCVIGKEMNITSRNRIAYYGNNFTDFIIKNMTGFNADIYTDEKLFSNLDNYTLLVLENPDFVDGNYSFAEKREMLENFVQAGNKIIFGGNLGGDAFNVSFVNAFGKNATFIREVSEMDIMQNESLNLSYNYAVNGSVDVLASGDGHIVFARWNYGNGTVYYLSNFSVRNKKKDIIKLIRYNINGLCGNFDFDSIDSDALVKIQRLCIVENRILTMEVYLWK